MTSDSLLFKAKRQRVHEDRPIRWAGRIAAAAGGAVIMWLSGCATAPGAKPAAKAPPSTDVSKFEAWRDAEELVKLAEGRIVVMGDGESMEPVLGANTVLVLNRVDFSTLRAGMQVAYINRDRRCVVHALTEQEGDGWRVRGFNNPVEDAELVTPTNLLGVVYASFATGESDKR